LLDADELAHLAAAPASALCCSQRSTPDDVLGVAAARLREIVCGWMLGPDGLDAFLTAYAPSRKDDVRSYPDFVRDTAVWEFADEHHLRALAVLLNVRIVVVPRYEGWAVQTHGGAAPPQRTIHLGNNDQHYVWLAAGAAAPSSPPVSAGVDVIDLLEDSGEESADKAAKQPATSPKKAIRRPGGKPDAPRQPARSSKKAIRKPGGKADAPRQPARSPKKASRRQKRESGRFLDGHEVGLRTRFRRLRGHYGTCRDCKSNAGTVSKGTDWYCRACCCYTKKRGAAGRKAS
jgi:hypothetical protein